MPTTETNPFEAARFEREVRDMFHGYQRASGDYYRAPCDVWNFVFHALEAEDVPSEAAAMIAAAASQAAEAEYRRIKE